MCNVIFVVVLTKGNNSIDLNSNQAEDGVPANPPTVEHEEGKLEI